MKKPILRTALTFCLCLFALTLLAPGCATPAGQGAYPTLKDTQRMVDWPMTRYRNVIPFGNVTLAEQQMVSQLYASYNTAFQAAVKAAKNNYYETTPDNVKALANQLLQALDSIPY